mmetsp:Transcript_5682/g.8358  ORF Transcript_5682/g.8358 Transcript_5682/m.8358 type:complete len:168 (-) Transcript_5682:2562-3065(-)
MEGISKSENKGNIFRDTPLRYMGYANEIGESFRYQFPKFVLPSYILAFGYCGMDAATAGYKVWRSTDGRNEIDSTREAALATFDTLLWQSLASVMIPGATINMIVKASRFAISRTSFLPVSVVKWFPTTMGISSIYFIIHPIDTAVDFALDNSTRQWIKSDLKEDKK